MQHVQLLSPPDYPIKVLVYYSVNHLKAYYTGTMNYSVTSNSVKLIAKAMQLQM